MGLGQYLEQRARLGQSQKQELRLLLSQKMGSPIPEEAVRGIEGMEIADSILKERKAVGLLIGSLSKAVWNARRKKEDLEWHSDVDVIVPRGIELESPFEGGVDWWLPKEGYLRALYITGPVDMRFKWHENGNGVVAPGFVTQQKDMPFGL